MVAGRKTLAFVSDRDGLKQIYLMNADGSNQKRLTNDTYASFAPAWSPDGKHIAYERALHEGQSGSLETNVYVMNADGSGQINISTIHPDLAVNLKNPAWSPDGSFIVGISSAIALYLIDATSIDYSRATQHAPIKTTLYYGDYVTGRIAWSPDGTRLAATGDGRFDGCDIQGLGVIDVFVATSTESHTGTLVGAFGRTMLSPVDPLEPAWSPDGKMIAFSGAGYITNQEVIYITKLYSRVYNILCKWSV